MPLCGCCVPQSAVQLQGLRKKKIATSFRLSAQTISLLLLLSDQLGINQTSVVELAIRAFAKKHHVAFEAK
jgi:hypothetical protein